MTKCCDERGSGCRRVSRCIYTEHSDIRCVSSPERFLCVEAGSHYELTGSEQNRRGSVQSVLTLLKWLQKHVQYFQTQETLPPCVSYTSPSLWDLNRPYSYARARLFGSDSSSKATKDIYFSGVPKYKYKAFNSSAASPDRRCTSHNPTSNQPNYHFTAACACRTFCQASSNLSKPTDQNLTTAAVCPEKLKQLQTVASSSNKAEKKGFRGISVGNIQLKHWIKTNKIHSTGYFKPVITSCGHFGGGPVTEWEKLTAVCFIVV